MAEIALIGHSMGGLVARSACHQGEAAGQTWVRPLRHVIGLGVPHLGAPLEQATNVATHALARVAELKPLATALNRRSAGIKDLRFGYCAEDDWRDQEPDSYLVNTRTEMPFLPTATYYYVGATLARDPETRWGRWAGDMLVRLDSASGKDHLPFAVDKGAHFGGMTHLHLLNHPAVYARLRSWLERPLLPAPARTAG